MFSNSGFIKQQQLQKYKYGQEGLTCKNQNGRFRFGVLKSSDETRDSATNGYG